MWRGLFLLQPPGLLCRRPRGGVAPLLMPPGVERDVDREGGAERRQALHGDAPAMRLGHPADLGEAESPSALLASIAVREPLEGAEERLLLLGRDVGSLVVHEQVRAPVQ